MTVTGDLDVVSAPDVREALRTAVAAHERVEVDCGRLTFCDCTGLSALLAAARAAKANGSELRLCSVPHALARLLRLTHAGSASPSSTRTDSEARTPRGQDSERRGAPLRERKTARPGVLEEAVHCRGTTLPALSGTWSRPALPASDGRRKEHVLSAGGGPGRADALGASDRQLLVRVTDFGADRVGCLCFLSALHGRFCR
ncbi:STAS domain-containing protein [Streptomyces sp. NPDC001817]|uniref:STAS domain-containing protein n=1 Tax=Streptomyces sp. NPDC001817 TaxID=3154398 RepID=UPI00331940F5